ncbi:Zinc-finger homeodomain protein 4, partial [Mucuna pruriens]
MSAEEVVVHLQLKKKKKATRMELSSQEGEIPIPIPIQIPSYGHGHGHGNGHGVMIEQEQNNTNGMQEGGGYRKVVRYRECLKNHAAAMGGNATDGCGEFMPSGEEGSIEALNCSACHCHRNFHRKETEADILLRRRLVHKNLLSPDALGYPLPSRTVPPPLPPHHMILPYNISHLPSESDDQEDAAILHHPRPSQLVKKRFRTKFSQEQKDKMLNFAHKVGWKIQKQEESVVQQFCQEIGVKRRVLKVWMHNNKHNLSKKNPPPSTPPPP